MWLPLVMTSTPASNSAAAVDGVRPMPPAMFSPLAVTRCTPRSSRRPGSSRSSTTRPGLPITSPIISTRTAPPTALMSGLLRVLHGARLADDGHLDLAGIGERLLDLAHDVARETARG